MTVHVLMLSLGGNVRRRRAAPSRFSSVSPSHNRRRKYESMRGHKAPRLLPESASASRRVMRQSHQYRITYQRPAGAGVPSQGISATTSREGLAGMLSWMARARTVVRFLQHRTQGTA